MDPELLGAARDTAIALAAKPLIEKMLGPAAEYVGRSLAGLLERYGNINVDRIFRKATSFLGAKADTRGSIDPRVLRAVIEDGSFASDPLSQTYFAGVLAASRTPSGDDDRGLLYLSTLKALSNLEVALHYKFYSSLRAHFVGSNFHLESQASHDLFALFVAAQVIDEDYVRLEDAIIGLASAGLLNSSYELNQFIRMGGHGSRAIGGAIIAPSHFGVRLYLWVHGFPDETSESLLRSSLTIGNLGEIGEHPIGSPIGLHRRRLATAEAISMATLPMSNMDLELFRRLAFDAVQYLWPDEKLAIPPRLARYDDSPVDFPSIVEWLREAAEKLRHDNIEILSRLT
jgi:hypothetical protein